MSAFSEYLTIIKNKRGLNSAEVANICGIDTTVIFRWMKGERIPEDIGKIRKIELKLRLSEQEKRELEDAYVITVYGKSKYKDFKEIKKFLAELRRYRDESNSVSRTKTTENRSEKSMEGFINSGEDITKEFKRYISKSDIINGIEQSLMRFKREEGRHLYIVNSSMNEEVSAIVRIYCSDMNCDIKHIVYTQNDVAGYGFNHSSLKLLWEAINVIFQNNNTDIYLLKSENMNEINWILSDYFFIQYNNEMTEGMMTTYQEWVTMQMKVFDYIKSRSTVLGKNEVKDISDMEKAYSPNALIKCIGYQPRIVSSLNEQILRKHFFEDMPMREEVISGLLHQYIPEENKFPVKEVKTFFSERGFKEFMNKGVLNIFPYRTYSPLTMEERCKIVRECVRLSMEGKSINYLIKDSKLSDLKNIHIEFIINDECSNVKIDVNNVEGKKERLVLTDEGILRGFDNFFACIENEKFVYSREETEQYMLKVVEEYEVRERP